MSIHTYHSLTSIPTDELAEKVGGRHRLTYLIAKRLRAINDGSPYVVDYEEGEAPIAIVCREIQEDKIWLEIPEEGLEAQEVEEFDILGLDADPSAGF